MSSGHVVRGGKSTVKLDWKSSHLSVLSLEHCELPVRSDNSARGKKSLSESHWQQRHVPSKTEPNVSVADRSKMTRHKESRASLCLCHVPRSCVQTTHLCFYADHAHTCCGQNNLFDSQTKLKRAVQGVTERHNKGLPKKWSFGSCSVKLSSDFLLNVFLEVLRDVV